MTSSKPIDELLAGLKRVNSFLAKVADWFLRRKFVALEEECTAGRQQTAKGGSVNNRSVLGRFH